MAVCNGDGSQCCDLRYVGHEVRKGKYGLKGLPAVYADQEEAETLEVRLRDSVSGVEVALLYGVLEGEDIITRSTVIETAQGRALWWRRRCRDVWTLWRGV